MSHSSGQLRRFCERGLYLESGELRADGPIEDIIKQYEDDTGVSDDEDGTALSLAGVDDTYDTE